MKIPSKFTTAHGLLFENGRQLGVIQADGVAHTYGFMFAEQMVKYLEKLQCDNLHPSQPPSYFDSKRMKMALDVECEKMNTTNASNLHQRRSGRTTRSLLKCYRLHCQGEKVVFLVANRNHSDFIHLEVCPPFIVAPADLLKTHNGFVRKLTSGEFNFVIDHYALESNQWLSRFLRSMEIHRRIKIHIDN